MRQKAFPIDQVVVGEAGLADVLVGHVSLAVGDALGRTGVVEEVEASGAGVTDGTGLAGAVGDRVGGALSVRNRVPSIAGLANVLVRNVSLAVGNVLWRAGVVEKIEARRTGVADGA